MYSDHPSNDDDADDTYILTPKSEFMRFNTLPIETLEASKIKTNNFATAFTGSLDSDTIMSANIPPRLISIDPTVTDIAVPQEHESRHTSTESEIDSSSSIHAESPTAEHHFSTIVSPALAARPTPIIQSNTFVSTALTTEFKAAKTDRRASSSSSILLSSAEFNNSPRAECSSMQWESSGFETDFLSEIKSDAAELKASPSPFYASPSSEFRYSVTSPPLESEVYSFPDNLIEEVSSKLQSY